MKWFYRRSRVVTGLVVTIAISGLYHAFVLRHGLTSQNSKTKLLEKADALSWANRWNEARPLYVRVADLATREHDETSALYAVVSEIPADESISLPDAILQLTKDLSRPEAQDAKLRLRILTIRGMLEIDYDGGAALQTWQEVQRLAIQQGQFKLATRAVGEQGIAAFLTGDVQTAQKKVYGAFKLSQMEHDPAATVRYASVYGQGQVEEHRFKESLKSLDEAITIAKKNPEVAYPTMAVYSKISALTGLKNYDKALALANVSLERLKGTAFAGHRAQVYIYRGTVERGTGNLQAAIADYQQAAIITRQIGDYRGIADADGLLASAYVAQGLLPEALVTISEAIQANTQIPSELYLVPRNLAIKAEIEARMAHPSLADDSYQKAIALINQMLSTAPTTGLQRSLLTEMSDVYSGYFALLCSQRKYNQALQVLDNVRGRIESEALQHHASRPVHEPTAEEREVTRLNIALINTDDPASRTALANALYTTEQGIGESHMSDRTITHPVRLVDLQRSLGTKTVLIEYVLASPASYALAITRSSAKEYKLPDREEVESEVKLYRKELRTQREDKALAKKLFAELLEPISEYRSKSDLIIIPDGTLHLLPFSALQDEIGYVLLSHTVDVNPSATVYAILHERVEKEKQPSLPYVGIAAWTQSPTSRNPFVQAVRAVSGPARNELVPLPESKAEVEMIAKDLPGPSMILEGGEATETRFKQLPLDQTDVIHLALHGYADLEYPDRSALIFAPDPSGVEDGLLQVREIRGLHLTSRLVTLSACNTGVGPTGDAGVVNLVNAFIEAGADSVVSTLWELSDMSTSHLMNSFYTQLAMHNRKVDALRSAQLDLLKQGLPPYFWASFQIVGDPNGKL